MWNLHFYRISVLDKILLASGSIIRYQPSLSWGKFDTSINIIVSRSWATERTSSLWGFWKLIEQNCYWFYSFIPSFELFRTKIICYQNVSTKFWIYSSMWFWFLVLLPLRFRKVGRLWCGAARETNWATLMVPVWTTEISESFEKHVLFNHKVIFILNFEYAIRIAI